MRRVTTTDVFVAGLGPAGASAAQRAALAGYSVLAVDRKHQPGIPVQCAEFVPTMLAPTINAVSGACCQRIDAMQTFIEEQSSDWQPRFPGVMVDRAHFDQLLVREAIDAGAKCQFETTVADIADDGRVTLTTGELIEARVIVGADGPRSKVGRAIGAVNDKVVAAKQITVAITEPHGATDIFLSGDYVGGYGWMFPRGARANVGIGVLPASSRALKTLLRKLHQSLFDQGRVGEDVLARTGGLIPVGGILDLTGRLNRTPVMLCGDAAGLTNPVTGAGISAAVQSGHLAGEAASDWLSGSAGAIETYREDVHDVFGASLVRALRRRQAALAHFETSCRPSASALRESWIAYPEYWAA